MNTSAIGEYKTETIGYMQQVNTTTACWHPYPLTDSHYHYYTSYCNCTDKNKFEQAFKIASRLIEDGDVKCKDVKNFILLVNKIQKEL